jgi:hypothetical protein
VAIVRHRRGCGFLGAVTDAMLLGHWYLVQPGLPRRLLNELVTWVGFVWPSRVMVMLLPTGMLSVLSGAVDDGRNGHSAGSVASASPRSCSLPRRARP